MLENKRNVKKIRKILIVLITIIITTNIFIQIKNLAKENTEKILKTEITTIGTDEIKHMKAINLDKGTINPIYKPEWTKISSSLDETNKTLSIIVKGNASKTQTNNGVNINYNSNVTTTLQADDIEVYIDGELDGDTNQNGKIDEGETSQIAKTVSTASPSATSAEITHTITLSGFEETIRKNGKNFKEWSGNISIKIGGRGQSTTTYTQDVLTDEYGNQNMMETDQNGTNADGSWINVTIQDGNIVANTEGKMFTDFIIPEYTYEYANTTIDHETKKVTIVFDVTDKYFANAQLTAEDITIAMIGDETSNVNTKTTKSLNLKTIETEITNATTGITYKTDGSIYYNGQKVGQRYELVIEGLEQLDENGLPNGYTYSGPMSIALPAGETNADGTLKKGIIDNSGNLNIGKTITIGIDETDGNMNTNESGTQQIVDVVDPIWSVGTSTTNATEKSATLTITGKDKYFKQSTLTEDKIKIYVNGVQTTAITKSLTTPTDIKETVDGVAEVVVGKEYTLTLSNLEPSTGGTGGTGNYTEFTPKNSIVGGTAKFRNENGGNIEIEIEAGTIEDQNQNFSNTQTFNLGYVDATVPEVYEVQKTKNTTEKTETIIFNVTDKNYDATDLVTKEEITVLVDGEQVDSINKSSLTSVEIITTIDGEEKIVGHQYTLVLSDFENATKNANGYKDYSGTVSIKIAENASKDTKGNTLNPATTTISDFVDFIKPVIEKVTVTNPIDTTNKTYTFKFTAIDKYMNIADLITPEEIKIYLDGVETTTITKTLTNTQINKTFKKTVDGAVIEGTHTIGHEYTLTLSGFEETQEQLATSGRNYLEWSGNLSIEILAGAVKDKGPNGDDNTPNQNELTPITGEFVDFIKPVIQKVSSTKNETAKTETIIFNVMDKYLETTDLLEDSEITVYVDGEEATTLTKQLTKLQDFTATVNGNTTHVVGQQYQLILSNFEQTRSAINRNREYSDWSGTISIDVEQGAVKDKGVKGDGNNPNINNQTTITGDFVDYIAPNITYEYVTGNIDYTGKTFTMVFDITDKYFTNSTLATEYANATTDEQKLAVLKDYLTIQIDGEDITNNNKITKKIIAIEDVKSGTTSYPLHKTIDGTVKTLDGTDSTLETHRTIGKRFTLEISDLEQEIVEVGDEYLDYSGIITVAIKNGIAKDTTENENIATTLTSGVNIPGGTGTGTVVDVVDPLWEVAGTATAKPVDQIASIPIKGTDKYLNTIGLTASDITVEVNGEVKTSTDGVTVSVQEDTTTILTYGKQYRVTVNGYAKDAYQVKITLREGLITDQSGNTSKQTSFILFSSLKETSTETSATSPFIGNTNIQRQKIEKIIFKDNLDGINSTRWDVSQLQDGSIWGWYTTDATTGNYTVYIGSYIIINGNVNSSYLFSHIGYNSNCKITGNTGATDGTQEQLIENLELLHVDSVTNMSNMFSYFGYSTMKTLDLGEAFDTGATTNMSNMFANCGYTEMTSLNLGEQFITTNVTNMSNMFENCGHEKITSLDLGDNFNTTNATNMSNMFSGCGYGELTSLDFGDNFNTTNVTNMSNMFANFGFTKLTSLDLGDNFYTTNVTNMEKMFYNCGNTAMLALDLGPNFTQIPSTNTDFATGFGTSGAVIYVPESIYKNRTSFKLNSGDTSTGAGTIAVSSGRIINPIYKPEWTKVSSTLDTTTDPDNPTLSVNIKANANKVQTINGVNINYSSQVTSALTQNNIFVYIDGELDGDTNQNGIIDDGETPSITKTVTTASPSVTSDEITHVITLSNFVETLRQSGKSFTEWSGNIAIKIGGRGEQTSTYTANVLKDEYGNQNMMEIEETEGWINVSLKDEDTDHNTNGIMFEDFIKPEFTYEYSNTVIDHDAKTVTVVFDVTDKYFNNTTLATDTTANNIDVTFDGETPTNATKTLTKLQDLSRTVNGTEQKIGERYSFVISNLDQGGGSDYSGVMTLAFPANIITDKSGNANIAKTITIGIDDPSTDDGDDTPVIVDVVDPIWKVENINIDNTNKRVTAVLIATDKYLTGVENSTLTINDITVTVDGDENANTAITKELTEPTFSTNESTGMKEIKYVLTLSNFEEATRQAGKSFLEYSGNVKIKIAEGTVTDDASPGIGVASPSELFDSEGTNANGLHIGDFVNYDAGTWTEEEISSIQTGLKTDLQTANGSTDLPSNVFQFGGYTAGSSRNGNVTSWGVNYGYNYNYVKDTETNSGVTGWRVFDIEGDTVTLISAGNPEAYYHRYESELCGHVSQCIFLGPETFDEDDLEAWEWLAENYGVEGHGIENVQIRNWDMYINGAQKAINIMPLTKSRLDNWYSKYIGLSGADVSDSDTFRKIYSEPYIRYQNMIDNYTCYLMSEHYNDYLYYFYAGDRDVKSGFNIQMGVRMLVTLSSDVLFNSQKTGTKTLTGGNMDTYGGDQTYNCWAISTESSTGGSSSGSGSSSTESSTRTDGQSNSNKEQEFELGHVDFIKPEIEKISSTKDETAKTETIIFNIMDKYLETTDVLEDSEITVYVDGEEATTLTKQLTKLQDFTATVNGDTTHIVGQQYKLVLSDFEKARNAKNYKDWSGTISIEIVENAVKDKGVKGDGNDPNTNNAKTIQGDFTDFINPDIKYVHQSTDINKSGKTYTMTFTVTDKYYTSGKLGIDDLTINMKNGKLDSDGNEIIYNLKNEPVTISLQDTDLKATNVPITNTSGNIETVSELLIGHTYILTISNLEQLEVKQGFTTADYSGVITVAFDGNKILDRTIDGKQNGNIATTITTGINIPGGTTPDDAQVVDVVDPIWEKISSSAYAFDPTDKTTSIATLTFKGTDSYFANSTLTSENIKIFVNGTEVTTGITKTLSTATPLQEQRKEFGTDTTINKQYGVQYTLTIKGWAQDAHQIKVQLPTGTITDESGNTNKVTELLVYNALRTAEVDKVSGYMYETASFLGNSTIQRQNIENITFVSNIPETVYNVTTGEYVDSTAWDVSARQDKTIIAWYETQTSGALKVYIGSNDEIFANQNSSYLFANIGYADICTATETITNINLLNVYSVTNMENMFQMCGYKAMTSLDLGDKFDTSNVTNMNSMFCYCGYESMTSLDLGEKFDTSNVTDMSNMFGSCGYESMTSLDLGEKFDTSNVTNMYSMFNQCGYESMTSLDLGEKFDTSNVTDMNGMFSACGYESMTSLDLGDKFDTSKVTSMSYMFYMCGYTKMTSLDLGDLFYTTSVTSMNGMFGNCGHEEMTSLDLGPAFTKIASDARENRFIKGCGKLGAIIYVPESIYKDITHLKLDTNSTTTIEYLDGDADAMEMSLDPEEETTNTRGTINPIYKPQWTKQTTTIDETNKTLNVTIKGNASLEPQTINGVNINYNSKVTSTLTGDSINIYIDGELDGDTNKNGILDEGETTSITRTVVKDETNSTDTEIYYTITLSNIEESLRQSGKNFKEWSGNISIQPLKGTLKDAYGSHSTITRDENSNITNIEVVKGEPGNGNMQEIDLTQGVWTKIELNDTTTDHNTEGTMFTDYIKPEFTYEYSNVETDTDANTIIDYENKKVTVVFDVTDKYFEQANITAENVTITVGGTEPDWTKVTKTLTKKTLAEDKVVGGITYKANGDIYYTINGTSTKIGERYELVVTNLETENGIGYSGVMTMSFPAGIITDKSNNTNLAKTITIGIDDPENHEEHQNAKIVDVVNPLWTGPHNVNTINRTNNTVDVKILGSDKYYQTDIFAQALENGTINTALNKIKIYVDNVEQTSITKTLTKITDNTELQTLAQNADLQSANIEDVKVGYTLTLSNFGDLSGTTKIVIEQGTITDTSGNENIETTIPVGNINWEEANEPLEESDENYPRYSAFRNDIVDFIKPVIKYQYSAIEGSKNPNIDYETKTLTVKFTVTDKYLVQSSIMNADGTLNTENVRLQISTLNSSGESEFTDITNSGITTTITSTPITNGYEYTLVVQNFELIYNNTGEYMDYSGIVQLVFAQGQIDDTSGNKNLATTITIDTDDGNDPDSGVIVDVIDPIIEKTAENLSIVNTNNNITRDIQNETGTVTIRIKATDKYLSTGTLQSAENVESIRVKIVKPDGNTIYPETITKTVTQISKQSTSIIYDITLGNFETNQGITSIIIPEGVITDTSGNVNQETEILVGNSTWTETGDTAGEYTAFKNSIVDFIRPTWEYSTSSITRNRDGETGTVTIKILGRDNYYLKDILTENKISVYVANSETPNTPITTITKALTKITDTEDLNGANTGYYLTLGNFQNYDGQVKIEIADNTIIDTSGNGNPLTQLNVGNSEWVETDIGDSETTPKYTAFRNSIVDFIKPIIRYQYTENANPLIDQENKQVAITFDAIDTNILESVITLNDIQILVDDIDVTDVLTKTLTSTDIPEGSGNGLRYTLTLSNFELENILDGETFKRHSGKIELIIAENTVRDTSGNQNRETNIIIDNDNGDDENNYIIVDFIKPKIYYIDKFISWDKRYAEITIAGTDRFYDFTTTLSSDDITLYQQNLDGNYVQVTNLPITVTPVSTTYGYNFVVRLDDFEEEYKMKISIPAGVLSDTQGHYNDATDIFVDLDNKKPIWKYISTNTSEFESNGNISFNVKGQDKFLDLENSGLEDGDVTIYKDGTDITNTIGVTITSQGQSDTEKSKTYKIDVTGLTEIGTYSLVIKDKTLIDEFDNESNTTTITFSKSAIATNTDNYQTVTYHASPDFEQTHQAYVHELMSVNTTGTNFENTTFRPSTIGEIYDDGKNTLFAEPFEYTAGEDGADGVQTAYSFKGWGLANEKGFIEDEATATIYGLYDEIPDTAKATDGIVHLKAIWQQATVIFVSNGDGDNANDGLSPETPVKDLQTAYSKIDSSGTALTNIIVIMDQIEWNSSNVLNGNATITSLYAGIDYKEQSAELKISSNIEVNGDIIFDNIKLYSNSTTVSDGTDYLANGSYTNMLITNYGDITLGRRILTPEGKYTFGAVVGGNYKTESTTGQIGVHKVIVEAGKYNNIVIGSALTSGGQTTQTKYVSHNILIGNMKDSAISRNDKLTITGYLSMGELEDKYYAYNTSGSQSTTSAYSRNYANTVIYSGTFTGENKFTKSSENASIYLRAINGFSEGKVQLDMYGADITGNLYAGSRMATTNSDQEVNILNFYGGKLTGNMFGNGANDTSTGCSKITFEGRFNITGNVFGGSNAITIAQGKVTGNTSILVNSSSVVIDGNIYGGSNGIIEDLTINTNNGLITGDTNIVLSSGTVNGDIYGSGYNCGNTGSTNITINNGTVLGNIYGGAYQNQVRTDANINILGGTVNAIYGGNVLTTSAQQNSDNTKQNANITINSETATINGLIYGSGKYDKIGTAEIYLISCANLPTVYGGSDGEGLTDIVNIYLQGMTVNTIYGGSNGNGTVTTSNINLKSGTVTDVYGGGYGGTTTTSNVNLGVTETVEGTETIVGNAVITSIYGGSNINGTVITSNVNLKSGTVTNVFGGGNSVGVGTANVTLDGITVNTIHGGSKNSGNTTNTNVVLNSGTVTNVFGGGYDVGATNTEVTQRGATVTNIYGGNQGGTGDGGETINTKINIDSSVANNIYGGNMNNGNIVNSVINIRGNSTINGKLYGGGYKSEVGKSSSNGSTTINISGGTINKDIFGGSEDSLVYGNTNINIGKNVVTDISPVAGNININGIYGGGTSGTSTNYSYISVYGNTHITMDNSTESPISFSGTIYGSGKGTNYSTNNTTSDESTIKISNFGSSTNAYQMVSIQRTGKLYIGNSYLELSGIKDTNNYYKNTSYTLNRITKGLALHDNSTLYTRKGFNIVGGFESFKTNADGTTEKQTVEISDNTVTRNVDNRIYTLEGINLIFAKQEGSLSNRASEDIWGDVNGMAFFGMYRQNRLTGIKEYDIYAPNYSGGAVDGFFANGSYIEGRHKANHDITLDGFYTNIADYSDLNNIVVTPQVIDVTDYGTYYDWIIGADIVNYQTTLIASTYSTWSMEELLLDYKYQQGATYTVNRVSTNALDTNINLINQLQVPTYSANANNTFALTMGTTETGWLDAGVTNIYTNGNGSFDGDINYGSDNSATPGKLIFKLYNSLNVTEDKDLGNINIVLTGKTRTGEDGSEGNTFKIVISVNIQSVYEEDKQQYTPRFTNSINTELNYTTDSSVDITYVLYKKGLTETIYTTGDYRVLSSTVQLPAGTKITMRDYGQGDNVNKVYYYQIQTNTDYDSTETVDGKTRYLYKLSKFIDMGGSLDSGSGTVAKYVDNNSSYYHSSGVDENGYVLEKYDISIDLVDSGIDTNQLEQETYLQLRSESGVLKYDNGDKDLIYNLYNQNAVMTQSISNEGQAYSVFENLTIPFTFDATLLEQQTADGENILDTKYYDKSVGLAIEIVNEVGERVKAPDVQNLKLTNTDDTTKVYTAGDDGVIRVPLSDGLATIKNNYKLSLSQYSVDAGNYIVRSYVFASDDGLHYGNETTVKKEFTIRFINRLLGLAGVESANDSRIINKSTGVNLEGNNGLDITVKVGSPTDDTNIRVELYKRNPTYTVTEDEDGNTTQTYNGIQYTKVDLKDYLQGTWETPEDQGLVTPDGCTEYMVMPKENYTTVIDIKNVEFERAVKDSISTGEYKLVFKAYYDNTLIQTVRKTFIVTP